MTFQTSSSSGGTEAVSEDQEHSGSEEAGDAIIQMDSYMPPSTKTPNVDAVKSVHAIDEIKTTITMPCKSGPGPVPALRPTTKAKEYDYKRTNTLKCKITLPVTPAKQHSSP
jgi:hypothetical protein